MSMDQAIDNGPVSCASPATGSETLSRVPSPVNRALAERISPTRATLETRRLAAADLWAEGWSRARIARHFGVSRTTVSRWTRAIESGQSLKARKAAGRPPRLSVKQRAELRECVQMRDELLEYAPDARFPPTSLDIAAYIWRRWRIQYHPDHARRLVARERVRELGGVGEDIVRETR